MYYQCIGMFSAYIEWYITKLLTSGNLLSNLIVNSSRLLTKGFANQTTPQVGVFSDLFLSLCKVWLQNRIPTGYWKSKENQIEYMIWLSEKLNIKSTEDWYKVSYKVRHFK